MPALDRLDTRQSDLRIYEGVVPTLRTGRHGILDVRNGALRALSGMEALLLQGFPLNYAMLAQSAIQNSALLSQAGTHTIAMPPKPIHEMIPLKSILQSRVDPRYTLSDKLWTYLQHHAAKHQERGNGFGFGLADRNGFTRTLSARYDKDGSEILIPQSGHNPRRLSPRECARLMGFPESFIIPVSDTQAYRQFGNSVCVPMMEYVARGVVEQLTRKQPDSCFNCDGSSIPMPHWSVLYGKAVTLSRRFDLSQIRH